MRAMDNELKGDPSGDQGGFSRNSARTAADIIDQGITMTGGSSQLRNLSELVYRKTGVKAYLADEALFCVAKGTGIALEHLGTYKKSIISKR